MIFFDLDGTLTDPKEGITKSIQFALEKLGHNLIDAADLEWCIGPPLLHSMSKLVGDADARTAVTFYRERFSDVGWCENRVYDGVVSMLAELKAAELPLFVATSKPAFYAEKILDHFELSAYFDGLFGSELDGTRSDKGELLAHALGTMHRPSRASMIGDRAYDMHGATKNGLAPIGVTYGYGSREELVDAGAKFLLHSPIKISELLLSK